MIERPDWNDRGGVTIQAEEAHSGHGQRHVQAVTDVAPSLVADLDPDLAADWERSGGIEYRRDTARDVAGQVVGKLAAAERANLVASFDGLPDAAQVAVLGELSLGSDRMVRPASDADLHRVAATPEGAAMVAEWRGGAARNIATVRARIELILTRIVPAEAAEAMVGWFDGLSPAAVAAVYRALVGRRA
jgi:hypothetical protein